MVKKTEETISEEISSRSPLFDLSRKILLAGIGAAALAQEEIDHFVNRLVDRGELAEKDARRLVKEVLDRREKMEGERRASSPPSRPPVATQADIEALSAKIAELNQKIEELKKDHQA